MHQTERLSTLTDRYREMQACADAVRYLSCLAMGGGSTSAALQLFEQRWPRAPFILQQKAMIPPASLTDPAWAGSLSPPSLDPILAIVRRETLPERIGFRKVPATVKVPAQTSLGTYSWVKQGEPKPVTRIDWTSLTLPLGKMQGTVIVERELAKLAPGTESAMTQALTGGLMSFQDRQLLDPAVAAVPDKNPASLTNGVTPITATGATLAAQVSELLAALFTNRPQTSRPVLIATPAVVSQLAASDANLTVAGGTFAGVPTFASPEAGALIVALDATGVVYADQGLEVDVTEVAAVQLSDVPDAPPTGATVITSLWQTNLVGYRVERFLWWEQADANVVQTLTVS